MTTAEDIERARADENRLTTIESGVEQLLAAQTEMRAEKREHDRLVLKKLGDFDQLRAQIHLLGLLLMPLYAGLIGLLVKAGAR